MADCAAAGEIPVDPKIVVRLHRGDEALRLDGQQIILAHQLQDALVVDGHAAVTEFDRDAPVAVTAAMLEDDLVDSVAHFHVFCARMALLEKTVESGAGLFCCLVRRGRDLP